MKEFLADKIEGEDWYHRAMEGSTISVVIATIRDCEVLAFIVEEHDNGDYTVFVPTAPTPPLGRVTF